MVIMKAKMKIVKDHSERDKRSDRELASSLKEGDEHAFDEFYNLYANKLFTLAVRLSGNEALAEEMFQEVMLHILKKIHLYNATAALSTWLQRVCVNFYISFLRKVKLMYPINDAHVDSPPHHLDLTSRLDIKKGLKMLTKLCQRRS